MDYCIDVSRIIAFPKRIQINTMAKFLVLEILSEIPFQNYRNLADCRVIINISYRSCILTCEFREFTEFTCQKHFLIASVQLVMEKLVSNCKQLYYINKSKMKIDLWHQQDVLWSVVHPGFMHVELVAQYIQPYIFNSYSKGSICIVIAHSSIC